MRQLSVFRHLSVLATKRNIIIWKSDLGKENSSQKEKKRTKHMEMILIKKQ